MRVVKWSLLGALVVALVGGAVFFLRRPASTPALRGLRVAEDLGCFACHGPGGSGGVRNPGSPDRTVPAWDGGTAMMYVESEHEIREWILLGAPRRLRVAWAADPSKRPGLVRMPAYKGRLSEPELADLIAYFKAVSAFERPAPEAAVEGRRVASRLGCFGCHGAGGRVGARNPDSFKGVIPAWDGADYAELVRNDEELRSWILDGAIPRFEQDRGAQYFIQAQAIAMPAYRAHLKAGELDALVAYIHWLRSSP